MPKVCDWVGCDDLELQIGLSKGSCPWGLNDCDSQGSGGLDRLGNT